MVTIKRWGNSMGIVIPKEIVEKQHLREGDEVVISVFKRGNLKDVFGTLKTKMSGQEFKDLREGDEVVISVFKRGNLKDVFGKLKTKMSGQEFKDLARKGWESSSDREFNKR
ncbi:AbrB/MazE/SpoVT family DNA-binding domain-containing protein [Candidatus Woesearchaeota archaeon]|nr:AbrB/MazE/SpoVT family DNA-binding domain-containing protein [Candidatus Woesearchaeota archaeon]